MKIKNAFSLPFIISTIVLGCITHYAQAIDDSPDAGHALLAEKLAIHKPHNKPVSKRLSGAKTISFNYDGEDLIDLINYLAAQKGVNIILPMANNAISAKLTLHIDQPITI